MSSHTYTLQGALSRPKEIERLDAVGAYRSFRFTALPDTIRTLTRLRCLRLWKQPLAEINPVIGELQTLEDFDFSCNAGFQTPHHIDPQRLTGLKTLHWPRRLPADIGRLTALRELKTIGTLPASIVDCVSLDSVELTLQPGDDFAQTCALLSRLPALRSVEVRSAASISLAGLGKLHNISELTVKCNGGLTTLRSLIVVGSHVKDADVVTLPASIGRLQALRNIVLRQEVPLDLAAVFRALAGCGALEKIDLDWQTGLTTLPPEIGLLRRLEVLTCQYTNLSSVPDEIARLSQLRSLSFEYRSSQVAERKAIKKPLPGKGWKQNRQGSHVELLRKT